MQKPLSETVQDGPQLTRAVARARPGSKVLLAPGEYRGGFYFRNLRGEPGRSIVLGAADPRRPPVIRGGGTGLQLSSPAHVTLQNLILVGATGNGLNIDDGGADAAPARGVRLIHLTVREVGPRGNHDGIKLSGVVDFQVENCTLENWGIGGGSGIDMVGCQKGVIERCRFRHAASADATGASGIQMKGGSREITVRANRFENAGQRAINLGGSTGLAYFRPPLKPDGRGYSEASAIRVEDNTFIGSVAPLAFVGVDGATVRFNTIYRPRRWALRILQETRDPRFVPCRGGVFADNLIAFDSRAWAEAVNIGPATAPETFRFARNAWYCLDAPARSRPRLPAPETDGLYGVDPGFRDPEKGDLRLRPAGRVQGRGAR